MEQLNHLFVEAGTLLFAGMVFVFTFLGLLIVFINTVLARLAIKFPDPVAIPSSRSNKKIIKKSANSANGEISPSIVAAISSAVTSYRHQHNIEK